MDIEIIKSYLLASHYLQERANYDLSQKPDLCITTINKIDNRHLIKGILFIDLGLLCTEKNHFETTLYLNKEQIVLKTKVKAINEFPIKDVNNQRQISVEGEPTFHLDEFKTNIIDGNKYLIHIQDETITKVYAVDETYNLELGMPKNLNLYKPTNQTKKRRSKIKSIIQNRH